MQAFIQYSRQFTMPITQVASQMNLLQSGVASAERVFALLDADEEEPDCLQPAEPPDPDGRVDLEHVSFRYEPTQPLIADFSLSVSPGQTIATVAPPVRARRRSSTSSCAFTRSTRERAASMAWTRATSSATT